MHLQSGAPSLSDGVCRGTKVSETSPRGRRHPTLHSHRCHSLLLLSGRCPRKERRAGINGDKARPSTTCDRRQYGAATSKSLHHGLSRRVVLRYTCQVLPLVVLILVEAFVPEHIPDCLVGDRPPSIFIACKTRQNRPHTRRAGLHKLPFQPHGGTCYLADLVLCND